MRIIGVLLVLVGLLLFASPLITYRTREKVIDTDSVDITATRQKAVVTPRLASVVVIGERLGVPTRKAARIASPVAASFGIQYSFLIAASLTSPSPSSLSPISPSREIRPTASKRLRRRVACR